MVQRAAWLGFVWALLVVACDDQATQPVPLHINLVFTGQPSNTFAGATFTPPILIQAEDLSEYRVDTFTGNVTIAIGTNPGGGTLSGTRTVAASNGVAIFRDLSIDAAGSGYTLRASAAGLDAATSSAFNAVYLPPCLTNNCWTVKAPMLTVRTSFDVGAVNGMLYTVGGDILGGGSPHTALATVEAYDPNTNSWTTRAPMPTARRGLGVGVVNGLLYAIGGIPAGSPSLVPTTTVEAYDPVTNSWTTKQPMPGSRIDVSVGVVNGIIYAVGGIGPSSSGIVLTGTVNAYDPVSNTWTIKAPMPTPRAGASVGAVNGIMYAVGGYVNGPYGYAVTGAVEAYDPLSNTWTAKAPMLTPRGGAGVGVVNGVIYAVGGAVDDPPGFGAVEAYDPLSNTWTAKAPMLTPRSGLGVGVVNGVLYAIGGGATGANEAYHP